MLAPPWLCQWPWEVNMNRHHSVLDGKKTFGALDLVLGPRLEIIELVLLVHFYFLGWVQIFLLCVAL